MKRHLSLIILTTIMVVASFLRLYNLESSHQFLGDQGRDALIVSKIFREFDPVFIGPVTSIGNLYLGPLYYYFMVPWLAISYPNPIGPSVAMALIGIVTVYLLYKLGKEMIGEKPAMIATGLYAISAVVIYLTRFSWNPNPAPLFGLLMIYSLYKARLGEKKHWLLIGLWSMILLQLHYMYLLAVATAGIVWLHMFVRQKTKKKKFSLVKYALGAGAIVIASFTPLVLFDLKHNGTNADAFYKLIFTKNGIYHRDVTGPVAYIVKVLLEFHGRAMGIMTELFVGQHRNTNTALLIIMAILIIYWYKKIAQKSQKIAVNIILLLIGVGIVGTSLYGHSVFSHYIAYLFPAVFLIFGLVLYTAWKWHLLGKIASVAFVIWFIVFNIPKLPIKPSGWQIKDMKAVAESIANKIAETEKYNIVLFSETGDLDGMNYRYFLYTLGKPPVEKEESGDIDTLVVINEGVWKKPVIESPVWDIVTFPNKNPSEVYQVEGGPEVTILRR